MIGIKPKPDSNLMQDLPWSSFMRACFGTS